MSRYNAGPGHILCDLSGRLLTARVEVMSPETLARIVAQMVPRTSDHAAAAYGIALALARILPLLAAWRLAPACIARYLDDTHLEFLTR